MAFKVILGLCHPNSYLSKERAGKARLNTMNLHQAEEICLPHVYTAPRPSERHHRHPPHALPKLSDTLKKIPLKKKKKHKKKPTPKAIKKKDKKPQAPSTKPTPQHRTASEALRGHMFLCSLKLSLLHNLSSSQMFLWSAGKTQKKPPPAQHGGGCAGGALPGTVWGTRMRNKCLLSLDGAERRLSGVKI